MWRVSRMGDTPDYIWEEAVVQYMKEKADKKTVDQDQAMLNWAAS